MRILVYRLGSLGDTVLALPCFRLIREKFPEATITVLTNAPVSGKAAPLASVLESTGLVDAVIPYPLGLRDPRRLAGLIQELRAQKFDLAISLAAARGLPASLRDYFFFRACGIPRVIGVPFRHGDLVCLRRPDGLLFESEALRLLRRVRSLGEADLHDPKWSDLALTESEKAEAGSLINECALSGPFLAASLGTKTALNDWGTPNWTRLLDELGRDHPGLGLLLLGSADEAGRSEKLLEAWPGPRASLCGKTSPRLSAALLARAALHLGHDSGPMHLAAAAGTRCVTIYSARCPPGQWFPVGDGHANLYPFDFYDPRRVTDLAHQQQALASIRVGDVRAAATKLLSS
jgi:ADP-heptose:LPS heptosyltransferase